jgi:hypothetical protein
MGRGVKWCVTLFPKYFCDVVFAGGSKIWECSLDLAQYVLLHLPESHSGQECPGSVLELGCGE